MFKEYLILLLLAHILGDFYVQTSGIAKKKEISIKWVLIHCLSYWITMFIISVPVISSEIACAITIAAAFHTLIDILKYWYSTSLKKKNRMTMLKDRDIFFIDQLLHLICLAMISYLLLIKDGSISVSNIFTQFFDTVKISKMGLVSWAAALLIIHKPANIAISKLLAKYKPENNRFENVKDNNTGRFIGTIERIIILIFISIGQYSAIGLVLTAKSIARYDRISKERDFAEYYLLGTLISTLTVIVVSFVIIK